MNFVVYILRSDKADKKYIGQSNNLIARFHSHNELSKKGWTVSGRPWSVIHVEFFESRSEALKREKFLKSGHGREWINDNFNI